MKEDSFCVAQNQILNEFFPRNFFASVAIYFVGPLTPLKPLPLASYSTPLNDLLEKVLMTVCLVKTVQRGYWRCTDICVTGSYRIALDFLTLYLFAGMV